MIVNMTTDRQLKPHLSQAIDIATRAIPPVLPLSTSVAVNPFLGQSHLTLERTAAKLGRTGGVQLTMPRHWYREKLSSGEIGEDDLVAALAAVSGQNHSISLDALRDAVAQVVPLPVASPTVVDLAAELSGIDWPGIVAERISAWAAGYFDEGRALWAAPRGRNAYLAWRATAVRDLTPEILGLRGFAAFVTDTPDDAPAALARSAGRLGLEVEGLESYFHRLLVTLGGWAHYARYQLWQAELAGGSDSGLSDLLAIRAIWEEALLGHYGDEIAALWQKARLAYAEPEKPTYDIVIDVILQEASERAAQRSLAQTLATELPAEEADTRPTLQAVFCIDVRSERYRRALEALDPGVKTSGFAGFFGIGTEHQAFASDLPERRLPVLLNPGLTSQSGGAADEPRDRAVRYTKRAVRAWGRFKLAAVSSFVLVEAAGPIYLGKLVRDALGMQGATKPVDPAPQFAAPLDLEARIEAVATILRAMSLTTNFAPLVILAGHGANVVNNPHASTLHCGACGGYSGEANARLLASLLNAPELRAGLVGKGIEIPADTLFVAGLHDTTTDALRLFDQDNLSSVHKNTLAKARRWLTAAGKACRTERELLLPRATNSSDVERRSHDWAELRPEWGLAGCQAFIAAPRERTVGKDLAGSTFLHDYNWQQDQNFGVLELIMTAPVVVASWISLQYYGSSVAPALFGAGNKLLHNVTGGIGVVEGNGGPLRPGLPWQSVHDGEQLVHEPLRLTVCIEAPREALAEILKRHEQVRALFDNRWLHLFALNENGHMAWRYKGELTWEPVTEADTEAQLAHAS